MCGVEGNMTKEKLERIKMLAQWTRLETATARLDAHKAQQLAKKFSK